VTTRFLNPGASAVTTYSPTRKNGAVNSPRSLLRRTRVVPVARCANETAAFGIIELLAFCTTPMIVPVACCASEATGAAASAATIIETWNGVTREVLLWSKRTSFLCRGESYQRKTGGACANPPNVCYWTVAPATIRITPSLLLMTYSPPASSIASRMLDRPPRHTFRSG